MGVRPSVVVPLCGEEGDVDAQVTEVGGEARQVAGHQVAQLLQARLVRVSVRVIRVRA